MDWDYSFCIDISFVYSAVVEKIVKVVKVLQCAFGLGLSLFSSCNT